MHEVHALYFIRYIQIITPSWATSNPHWHQTRFGRVYDWLEGFAHLSGKPALHSGRTNELRYVCSTYSISVQTALLYNLSVPSNAKRLWGTQNDALNDVVHSSSFLLKEGVHKHLTDTNRCTGFVTGCLFALQKKDFPACCTVKQKTVWA